jgi:nucleoside-diphosphate-sugar epimerase
VNVLDIALARRELQWQPTVPFDAGLARALEWLRSIP